MLIAIVPLIVAVIGLLLWLLASKPEVKEMGKILFFVGVLWTVFPMATKTIKVW